MIREIHPAAAVHPSAVLGPFVTVGEGAQIGEGVVLGQGVLVEAGAQLGSAVHVGPFSVIGARARIGAACLLGAHVVIHDETAIGQRVRIDDGAVLGKRPMKAVNSATTTIKAFAPLEVGDDALVGAYAVLYRGAKIGNKALVADFGGVREETTIGEGTIVGRGAYVENLCTVGRFVKIETMTYVAAYSSIGDRAFVAPMVTVTNDNYVGRTKERFQHFKGVTIERGGRVGANATLLPGAVVETDALVGAGSVLRGRAPARQVCYGQPAKPKRPVPEAQLIENQGYED